MIDSSETEIDLNEMRNYKKRNNQNQYMMIIVGWRMKRKEKDN